MTAPDDRTIDIPDEIWEYAAEHDPADPGRWISDQLLWPGALRWVVYGDTPGGSDA